MDTHNRRAIPLFQRLLVAAGSLVLASSAANAQQHAVGFVDLPAARRILVAVGGDSTTGAALDTIAVLSVGGRMSHAVKLHGIRVEVVDSARRPARRMATWDVTLFVAAAHRGEQRAMEPMVRLTSDAPEIRVPKPYGIQLEANDSLLIVATVHAADFSRPPVLQVTIEYEPSDGPVSRLAVRSLCASEMPASHADDSFSGNNPAGRAWTWRPAEGGRMVAIAGRALAGAEELVLEDATTGEVLWSTRAQNLLPGSPSAQQGETIRPSVNVREGRSYRLRAIYANAKAALSTMGSGMPLAMVFPGRTP